MNENILRDIKILFDIKDNESDEKLSLLIRLVLDEIRLYIGYSKKEKLPEVVESVALSLTRKYLQNDNMGIVNIKNDGIKSVKRGDTTIEYSTSDIIGSLERNGVMADELRLLRHLKRTRMV